MARSKMSVYVKQAAVQANEAAIAAKKEKLTLPDIVLGGPEMNVPAQTKGKKKAETEIAIVDETAIEKPKQPLAPRPIDDIIPDNKLQAQLPQNEETYWQAPVADNETDAEEAQQMQKTMSESNAVSPLSPEISPMASSSLEPLRVLEAALFMSSQSMQAADLGKLVGIGAVGHVSKLLEELSNQYNASGSSLEVVEENAGKWVMRIRASFAPSVRRFAGEAEIPKHALRTLAYISRHEGITKRDLFRRLGGSIYEDVADLTDKGFLQTKPQGRTQSLSTTTKFKQYFQG